MVMPELVRNCSEGSEENTKKISEVSIGSGIGLVETGVKEAFAVGAGTSKKCVSIS